MGARRQVGKVIVKNFVFFTVAVFVFLILVTSAQWKLTQYKIQDVFTQNLKVIHENRQYFEAQMEKLGMNETEYAWYWTYKVLRIKPTFTGTLEYYFKTSLSVFKDLGSAGLKGFSHPMGYYLKNTIVILILVELCILAVGTYLGLRAGYRGGRLDSVISTMAQLFSAIPVWFIGAVVFLLAWRFSVLPDFAMRIQLASTEGSPGLGEYAVGFALPAIAMILSATWEYAFTLRNIVVSERKSDHITYDIARGLPDGRIMKKLLRVVFPSFLTYTTYNFMDVFMSVLVIELVFDVPGLGYILLHSFRVINKPPEGVGFVYYPEAIFVVGFAMLLIYFINSLLTEIVYVYLDPRVRRQ
ncbi:ABC transporter permease [Thermococcus sp.]|uniref:ABC transporter permease subunit n=1 Tax=Thermococcus sp. TaxID=35749 RepID=UPI00261A39A0|nr:ABC transporter permease [Thermococcus sp.]